MIESSLTLALTRRFKLHGIHQPITLNIWQDDATGAYLVTTSHAIQTPHQRDPDLPTASQFATSPASAAENVTSWYDVLWTQAVEAGFKPSADWLVAQA